MSNFFLKLASAIATFALLLTFSGVPAKAATVCVDSTVDADGEFICTEWENTDTSDGSTLPAPTGLAIESRTSTSVLFTWDSYEGATGWVISFSTDNADTWKELIVQNPDANMGLNLTKLKPATAMWAKIAALAPDRSAFGDVEFASTSGAKPVTARVVDSKGKPVQGGRVTWELINKTAKSSKTYGLTDQGAFSFPSVPAGQVQVTLTDGLTNDGALVSGAWRTTLGFDNPVLRLPAVEPSKHKVKVVLENGMPVIGATVEIPKPTPVYGDGCLESEEVETWIEEYFDDDGNLVDGYFETEENCITPGEAVVDYEGGAQIDSTVVSGGFTFTSPVGPYSGTTDVNGEFSIFGFFTEEVTATVIYDDGVITQEQEVPLSGASTRVQLEYMPYVAPDYPVLTVYPDKLTPITVSVNDAEISPASVTSLPSVLQPAAVRGVKVSLLAPKGLLSSKCKSQLSAVSNAKGKVILKICAAKSGVFTVKGVGAASVSTIRIQVKGTAPMPVRSAVAKSPSRGNALVSWTTPAYNGQSPVTSYKIVASSKGKATVVKTVKSHLAKVLLTGLANATNYQIKVYAINSKGSSDPFIVKVPVS